MKINKFIDKGRNEMLYTIENDAGSVVDMYDTEAEAIYALREMGQDISSVDDAVLSQSMEGRESV